jgi:hypothetical protein
MARPRSALRPGIGLFVSAVACAFAPEPAAAVPTDCPNESGPSFCVVTIGDNLLEVDAANQDLVVYEWDVAGVSQLYAERFPILDVLAFPQQAFVLNLESATADDATATIEVHFVEAEGVFHESATFVLTATPDGAVLDESIALDTFTKTRATRLYAATDFDLDGTSTDESIEASTNGSLIVQKDGDVTAVLEADPPPGAFQVGSCPPCTVSNLANGTVAPFPLDGTTTVQGPTDFASAVSWDNTLGSGDSFAVSLRRQITVPEPTFPLGAVAGVLALLALRAVR